MSERHDEGTWIVPMSSADSSRRAPKSYDRHASVNAVAASLSLGFVRPVRVFRLQPLKSLQRDAEQRQQRVVPETHRDFALRTSGVPGVCWFISDTS